MSCPEKDAAAPALRQRNKASSGGGSEEKDPLFSGTKETSIDADASDEGFKDHPPQHRHGKKVSPCFFCLTTTPDTTLKTVLKKKILKRALR